MVVARDAKERIAPRVQKVILAYASPMGVDGVANILNVQRVHRAAQISARHMVEVRGAHTWVARKGLKDAHPSAKHMVEGSAVHFKSVHGGTQFCVAHGGGKRCAVPNCTKSARGKTDFCVRHGGGKRCKTEGCGKSAQGSTDFCKAHGGGNRCTWGQPGSNIGTDGAPCDRFARGKLGLCAAHTALVEDHCVHGGHQLVTVNSEHQIPSKPEKMKEIVDPDRFLEIENLKNMTLGWSGIHQKEYIHPTNPLNSMMASLPEGRVHGGSLIAMLVSNAGLGGDSASQVDDGV
ncbi:hypothetical protein C4D60_Mb10t15200 [Musa balbisiana]|uniref:WRKY19-like zinc finger domain-containing protein n=1 Tax=Musa balbisiana TaxID=52838 RepID=A0A4S8IXC8_MUSBA|nr:hypothetical protein C4D60_Mb10t15200 [Musa balbisiana]